MPSTAIALGKIRTPEAREILHQHKVEKLLVVDHEFRLKGLITVKDIQKMIKYPNACKDALGRLRCAAARVTVTLWSALIPTLGGGSVYSRASSFSGGNHLFALGMDRRERR
mgnify:CR=1 FL=1